MKRISGIGELGLIRRIAALVKSDSSVIKGIGDDCAVLKLDRTNYLLLTCDMLVEGIDFTRRDPPGLIGRKALAVSISDIAACAGIPRYALVSLGLPQDLPLKFFDAVYRGIVDLAGEYKINIVGGDLSRSRALSLDVTVAGVVEKNRLVLRSGARPGDVIFVTGELGGSIAGKHLEFTPRLKESRFLTANFKPSSMIDISDGLSLDLSRILEASRAGAVIYEDRIPRSRNCRSLRDALGSGEDFELLFTLAPKQAKRLIAARPKEFKPVGFITRKEPGLRLVTRGGREVAIKPSGYQHF